MNKKYLDTLTYDIVGAAIEVHRAIGPGLLSEVYDLCLKQEFRSRRIDFVSRVVVPVEYKGLRLNTELFCDFVIAGSIAVSVLSVAALGPIHTAQMLTYMNLLRAPKGIVLNFNCTNICSEGRKTVVNELFRDLPAE